MSHRKERQIKARKKSAEKYMAKLQQLAEHEKVELLLSPDPKSVPTIDDRMFDLLQETYYKHM
ncbi:hypothetical protein AB4455_04970 [Vibrio sp. 10N.261.46.E12]|uniref:hypothetical protein n=1 Tax=unclassified Vibrio TaxID=2614977 RepID=UPI0009756E01|nr:MULTISPECIES: hypothetical protein [unclassified Vibrio]OMO38359.1 hypothetical protein BH584_18115 [Vibrio sp. 10N.261.45.E1]PMJ34663.1 hypothetical protein BCU27_24580 [Vibrio sp. 10N.286.45.B6]PML96372.1 hypothetical protein BCT66_22000 [Vibrio sp. 10N.261.49.E11]PMM71951.1 hypothetical protein BCT48_07660 [Vibrio sp. 10N.261.46.F12]PMM78780.1 hypothetical protein BCT46_21975 [Vibrio sp. 10N.261.46.E8]